MGSVILATGTRVTDKAGAPTIKDMAISLSRIPRFSGNGWSFFPVALHSFIVADLVPERIRPHALIHDGPECAGNDVPKPFKTAWTKRFETKMFERTLLLYELEPLTKADAILLKEADVASLHAEAWTVGPPNPHENFKQRFPEVEKLVKYYARKYPPLECVRRGGACPREFVRRFYLYKEQVPAKLT